MYSWEAFVGGGGDFFLFVNQSLWQLTHKNHGKPRWKIHFFIFFRGFADGQFATPLITWIWKRNAKIFSKQINGCIPFALIPVFWPFFYPNNATHMGSILLFTTHDGYLTLLLLSNPWIIEQNGGFHICSYTPGIVKKKSGMLVLFWSEFFYFSGNGCSLVPSIALVNGYCT